MRLASLRASGRARASRERERQQGWVRRAIARSLERNRAHAGNQAKHAANAKTKGHLVIQSSLC